MYVGCDEHKKNFVMNCGVVFWSDASALARQVGDKEQEIQHFLFLGPQDRS